MKKMVVNRMSAETFRFRNENGLPKRKAMRIYLTL